MCPENTTLSYVDLVKKVITNNSFLNLSDDCYRVVIPLKHMLEL